MQDHKATPISRLFRLQRIQGATAIPLTDDRRTCASIIQIGDRFPGPSYPRPCEERCTCRSTTASHSWTGCRPAPCTEAANPPFAEDLQAPFPPPGAKTTIPSIPCVQSAP